MLSGRAEGSAAGRVARELLRRIADGSLPPGSKLPGETVLARRLGVSRPTVREAIRTLTARRLLAVRPRSGTYVAAAPPVGGAVLGELAGDDPERLWELVEIRRTVEPAVAALAAARRTPANLAALTVALAGVEAAAGRGQAAGRTAYGSFFEELARAARNVLLAHLARGVLVAIVERFPSGVAGCLAEEGGGGVSGLRSILTAVERGDEAAARKATHRHLEALERRLREAGTWS